MSRVPQTPFSRAHSVRTSVRRAWSRIARGVSAGLVLGALVVASPASAALLEPDEAPLAPESGAYFGVTLDWGTDSAAAQAERLGAAPAVFEHVTPLPVTDAEAEYLEQFLRQAAAQGALPVVSLHPDTGLADFDDADAREAVAHLIDARDEQTSPVYVRFAPDMNAPWVPWGQDPEAYVGAFRVFAEALREGLPDAALVWSPFDGAGYPFAGAPASSDPAVDTDGDGELTSGDDPYGPYDPGAEYVDWVGLTAYHDPSGGGSPVNRLPGDGDLAAKIDGEGALAFYTRFAAASEKPMMLDTGAMYAPGAGGSAELPIKQSWWRQVMDVVGPDAYPLIDVAMWRDATTRRAVVGEVVIDWSLTESPAMATAFRRDADESDLVFGPVYEPSALAPGGVGLTIEGAWVWAVAIGVLVLTIALTLWLLLRRRPGPLAYEGPGSRDLRIDLLRGVAIVFVIVNHLALTSLLQNATQEAIGIVSGAELFVLLSGVVLGMVYRPKVLAGGIGEVTVRTGRRAWKLYVTALAVSLIVGALSLLPFLDTRAATTFVDEGTGAAGSAGAGRVYDLYAGFDRLTTYPVDPSVIVDLALLQIGPWQVNVLGLYVILLAVSPLILWGLGRGRWLIVLAVSWTLYIAQAFLALRILPSQFEDSFPLLTWQVLFVTGMVAGFYRREIIAWFLTPPGRVVLALCIVGSVSLMLLSWSNPYLSSPWDVRLGLVPANEFTQLYATWFERTTLDIGRLLNVLLFTVTAYAVLSVCWKPFERALGWFLIPLGQATLYVFIMQMLFVLIVANVPVLREGNVLINTLAYVAVLGALWAMVKTRFLFGIVPR
ncbi:OpgC domain-containing protein [Microbacterium sp. ARD31]|uniref:OpgC domain-containing protein n=1 Tax=Microbacterium sp. ARD31 TaxID=2962576 RepID=UPI0028817030|nr:OpgC domain-containing protein [Microbacterium sp. ARD31]MDT0187111.1 OpgC domain-containing protein [Microbacterium sp. ARD31]